VDLAEPVRSGDGDLEDHVEPFDRAAVDARAVGLGDRGRGRTRVGAVGP
jgi:hypothetical protein